MIEYKARVIVMNEKIYHLATPKGMMRVPESKLEEYKELIKKWKKEEEGEKFSKKVASLSNDTIQMISDLAKQNKHLFYQAIKVVKTTASEQEIVNKIRALKDEEYISRMAKLSQETQVLISQMDTVEEIVKTMDIIMTTDSEQEIVEKIRELTKK